MGYSKRGAISRSASRAATLCRRVCPLWVRFRRPSMSAAAAAFFESSHAGRLSDAAAMANPGARPFACIPGRGLSEVGPRIEIHATLGDYALSAARSWPKSA
jgi:hypothetical protein